MLDGAGTAIPLSGGPDFVAKSIFHVFQIHLFAGPMDSNTFVNNLTVIMVLREITWGKMSVMTVGSLQVFIKNVTLTRVLHFKVQVFPEISVSVLLFQQLISLWRTDM